MNKYLFLLATNPDTSVSAKNQAAMKSLLEDINKMGKQPVIPIMVGQDGNIAAAPPMPAPASSAPAAAPPKQSPAEKEKELANALQPAVDIKAPAIEAKPSDNKSSEPKLIDNSTVKEECKPGWLKTNVTLKGGKGSGEFIEIKGVTDMKECVKRCCDDRYKKCNLAFMLSNSCYSVACKEGALELCKTIPAPPSKFKPLVQYVRGLEEEPEPPTTKGNMIMIFS